MFACLDGGFWVFDLFVLGFKFLFTFVVLVLLYLLAAVWLVLRLFVYGVAVICFDWLFDLCFVFCGRVVSVLLLLLRFCGF